MAEKNILVEFDNVTIAYEMKKQSLRAVRDFSLQIEKGKITAIVGESGSGKTTAVSALLQAISTPGRVTNGHVYFYDSGEKVDVTSLKDEALRRFRWEKVSMVFQASQSTLNPLMTIYDQFYEKAFYHNAIKSKEEFDKKLEYLFDLVKMDSKRVLNVYPHQMSGGMKQRVMIAFALLLDPELIILDEPTTALDVITQKYIFNQLIEINKKLGTTFILLTHDIGIVAKAADNVAVMYAGSIMEYGDVYTIFGKTMHPYTHGLINATPSIVRSASDIEPIPGSPPDIRNLPEGCPFHPRCKHATEKCRVQMPETKATSDSHIICCHLYDEDRGGETV